MCNCFHCGGIVVWDSDFSGEEMGYEEECIVHVCHCEDCGAEIEYRVPLEREEDAE